MCSSDLEGDAYIQRCQHEQDGRVQRLYLTERGIHLHNEVCAAHLDSIEQRFAALSEPTTAQLTTTLTDLNRALADTLSGS